MKAITLRNIPPEIQKAIRAKAKEQRISINRAVLELLQERVGKPSKPRRKHTDLTHLAGTWSDAEAEEFDRSLREQRQIDEELWR
ncbi:MAG: hypothetical protein DMF56_15245 [Acidobacteria bacterium]|nr:MAG: hypothetical protein DMF56_15245 [Acidobacteriota bacterium]